jgi:hypothetical protein
LTKPSSGGFFDGSVAAPMRGSTAASVFTLHG